MQDKEFAAILQDESMQPLALVPLTEEEQVWHKHTGATQPTWYLAAIQGRLQSCAVGRQTLL